MALFKNALAVTITATAQSLEDLGFSAAQAGVATYMAISPRGSDDVVYLTSGQTPTAALGHFAKAGQTSDQSGPEVRDALFIRSGAANISATIEIRGDTNQA